MGWVMPSNARQQYLPMQDGYIHNVFVYSEGPTHIVLQIAEFAQYASVIVSLVYG